MHDKDQVKCPFCDVPIHLEKHVNFFEYYLPPVDDKKDITSKHTSDQTQIAFVKCHSCQKTSIFAANTSLQRHFSTMVYPLGSVNDYSDYAPAAVCQDYQEAALIVNLSPKAAATLCRRCVQGMIRDHWNISTGNLGREIELLRDKIPEEQWIAIDRVRRIGNIGAHMEKDVNMIVDINPSEAKVLLDLVEYLIYQWYVVPCESEKLFSKILETEKAILNRRAPEDRIQQ